MSCNATLVRPSIALALVLTLSYVPVASAAGPLLSAAIREAKKLGHAQGDARARFALMGLGAEVKVILDTGERLEGTITALDQATFGLSAKGRVHRVSFGDVSKLAFAESTYHARGSVDVATVRRVVTGLDVGRHIEVRTTTRRTFFGHIQHVGPDSFVLDLDGTERTLELDYADVQSLGPNLSTGAKVAIWVGVGLTALIVIAALAVNEAGDEFRDAFSAN